MASAPTFALRIHVRPSDGEKAFVFEPADGKGHAVGERGSLDRALFTQHNLRIRLEDLKAIGRGAVKLERSEMDKALNELYTLGDQVIGSLLVGEDPASVVRLYNLVESSIERVRRLGQTPLVQIVTGNADVVANSIPFELTPFMAKGRPMSVVDDDSRLGTALDGFLGFSAVIARAGNLGATDLQRHDAKVPIKLFHNADLPSALEEAKFLNARAELDVDGPWPPEGVSTAAFNQQILKYIFDPDTLVAEPNGPGVRPLPDQIQHFACHCETFGAAIDHRVILGATVAEQRQLLLQELGREWRQRARNNRHAACPMPLVFLNACGGSAIDPRQVGSFVEFFLSNRNRGFIGVQTMIPDAFATEFCKRFYENLLLRGLTVGEALLLARRHIAERRNNILGILYMHYGPSELRVARGINGPFPMPPPEAAGAANK